MKQIELFEAVSAVVGPSNVTDSDVDLLSYSRDLSPAKERTASIIARPKSTNEVSAILRLANRNRVPIYVRGAGTSHWASWLPIQSGILLDMSAMETILEINRDNLTATVQTGCTWNRLDTQLRENGLTYLSSEMGGPAMTIGGSIAKAGGGAYCATKFGFHGQLDVLGVEFVLPTGEIVRTGSGALVGVPPFRRYGIGPDLTGLLIGSEGTLGIITEVTLRVRPRPDVEGYLTFNFDKWGDFMEVGDTITCQVGDELAQGLQAGEESGSPGNVVANFHLSGYDSEILGYRTRKIREICRSHGGKEDDGSSSREFFSRATSGLRNIFAEGVWHFAGDGYVPIRRLPEFSEVWREIVVRKYAFPRSTFGAWAYSRGWTIFTHLRYREPAENELVTTISNEMNRKIMEMGAIPFQIGPADSSLSHMLGPYYDLLKSLKRSLDPNRILQPGILVE